LSIYLPAPPAPCTLSLHDALPISLPLGGTLVRTLSAEHLLLVLCAHGAKHCWERLGWICDVAELLRGTPALDLSGMLAQARSLRSEEHTSETPVTRSSRMPSSA